MGKTAKKVQFAGLAASGGALAGGALSGAGGTTITSCPPEDDSFYCTFVKGFGIFKMMLVILAVLIGVGLLIWFIAAASRSKRGRGGGGGGKR